MASHGVRSAFDALEAAEGNLLTPRSGEIDSLSVSWHSVGPRRVVGTCTAGHGRGTRFTVIGVVDRARSQLGPYGDCHWDTDLRAHPSKEELLMSRFYVDITYPDLNPGHPDEDISAGIVNQLYRLHELEQACRVELQRHLTGSQARTDGWSTFQQSDRGTRGWMRVFLGHTFQQNGHSKGVPVSRNDVDDPLGYASGFDLDDLRHNPRMPCFAADGSRLAHTSQQLRDQLAHGTWVTVELDLHICCEMNLVSYELSATRLCPLPGEVAHVV